jgi:acetaldehyde dehydrogenase / alcohol dehydrogenase
LLFNYLPCAYKNRANDPKAREKVHYAATIAEMAFANSFLGVCHSVAHQLGATCHVPRGLANALRISHVILYNATDVPFKQAIFSQNKYPNSKWRYARLADYLNLGGDTEEEKVEKLSAAVEDIKGEVDIPSTIQEALASQGMISFLLALRKWPIALLTIGVPERTPLSAD